MAVDAVQAVAWYRLTAEAGNIAALFGLGHCYVRGEGVKADQEQALVWLNRAVAAAKLAGIPLSKFVRPR